MKLTKCQKNPLPSSREDNKTQKLNNIASTSVGCDNKKKNWQTSKQAGKFIHNQIKNQLIEIDTKIKEILEYTCKNFKAVVINIIKYLKKTLGNLSRNTRIIKRTK